MSCNSILSLPRKVRDKIYIYALSSATGYLYLSIRTQDLKHFALVPFEPPNNLRGARIRPSLLQTCKQIYHEAKDVIYTHNTWALLDIGDLPTRFRELDVGLSRRLRHIWLGVGIKHRDSLKDAARGLEILSGWARPVGNLQTVTLSVVAGRDDMHDLMELRALENGRLLQAGIQIQAGWAGKFQKYLSVLRNSWGKYDGQWAGVSRKLDFMIGYLKEGFICEPWEMVKEMHDAFGGELWIDGRLCYMDGIEVLQPFKRDFRGEWQVAWFREDEDWFWGR